LVEFHFLLSKDILCVNEFESRFLLRVIPFENGSGQYARKQLPGGFRRNIVKCRYASFEAESSLSLAAWSISFSWVSFLKDALPGSVRVTAGIGGGAFGELSLSLSRGKSR
jgi:hypothetical protein